MDDANNFSIIIGVGSLCFAAFAFLIGTIVPGLIHWMDNNQTLKREEKHWLRTEQTEARKQARIEKQAEAERLYETYQSCLHYLAFLQSHRSSYDDNRDDLDNAHRWLSLLVIYNQMAYLSDQLKFQTTLQLFTGNPNRENAAVLHGIVIELASQDPRLKSSEEKVK